MSKELYAEVVRVGRDGSEIVVSGGLEISSMTAASHMTTELWRLSISPEQAHDLRVRLGMILYEMANE